MDSGCDVVVVGGGNAALCAALAASETGAKVALLERASEEKRGGNSKFTGGGFRMVHHGAQDIKRLVPDLSEADIARTDFGQYTAEDYLDDLGRITQYYIDPDLAETLVQNSTDTVNWLMGRGVKFLPNYGRQAYNHEGRFKFFGGVVIYANGGGAGLVDSEYKAASAHRVMIHYNARAISLIRGRNGIEGLRAIIDGAEEHVEARAVVLACGGFESNREWRSRYLGPGWDMAKVRGTRYNTGDGIRMALDIGAQSYGQWSGAHAVAWERYANDYGDVDGQHSAGYRHSYPFGLMVNANGERFVDEGADFRNYTYAKYGRAVLSQPGGYAWQVFDAQALPLLRDEYKMRGATKVRADTLEDLVAKMQDVNPAGFMKTILEYNAAVKRDVKFDPNIKDGKATAGLTLNKSNWANPIDEPPFCAFPVTGGITFTFGGVGISTNAQVLNTEGRPVKGLYASGDVVGLFFYNYPACTGQTRNVVFSLCAARHAAARSNA